MSGKENVGHQSNMLASGTAKQVAHDNGVAADSSGSAKQIVPSDVGTVNGNVPGVISTKKAKAEAEEEEFPDDIQEAGGGEDDMYGDSLDSGWIGTLKGMKLIREAECLVACALLRRDNVSQPCVWRGVLADALPATVEAPVDAEMLTKFFLRCHL